MSRLADTLEGLDDEHAGTTARARARQYGRCFSSVGYAALMQAAAETIVELARDKRYVGGTVGVLAVLHTWTQQLVYTMTAGIRAARWTGRHCASCWPTSLRARSTS